MSFAFGGVPRAAVQTALDALDVQTATLTDGTAFNIAGTGWQTITPTDLILTAANTGRYAITYSVHGLAEGGLLNDQEVRARLTKNGTAIAGSEVMCVRQPSQAATDKGSGSRTIYATLTADDVIRVEVQQEQNTTTAQVLSNSAGRSSLALAQLS